MGREVRRVPPSWNHPRNAAGHSVPLNDGSFAEALADYRRREAEWNAPGNETRAKYEAKRGEPCPFSEWDGEPPRPETYRPDWKLEDATAFQVYENVSEGTPVSPVFATRYALIDWLVNDGSGMGIGGTRQPLSREAAERFVGAGFAPSMIGVAGVGLFSGVLVHERPAAPPKGG